MEHDCIPAVAFEFALKCASQCAVMSSKATSWLHTGHGLVLLMCPWMPSALYGYHILGFERDDTGPHPPSRRPGQGRPWCWALCLAGDHARTSCSARSMASTTDADYLQRLVGDVLARGCAAVAALRPDAPVEALAAWLQGRAPTAFLAPSFCKATLRPPQAHGVLTRC